MTMLTSSIRAGQAAPNHYGEGVLGLLTSPFVILTFSASTASPDILQAKHRMDELQVSSLESVSPNGLSHGWMLVTGCWRGVWLTL